MPTVDVSVLLATYGRATMLARVLGSLAAQTLDPDRFEVVVIVNGPADGATDAVESFAAEHPRIDLRIVTSVRAGVAHARNLGLGAARGTYVTTVDDDDWVSPEYLERLVAHAEPGVIPLAKLADIHERDPETSDYDNYYSNALVPHEGATVPALAISQGVSLNVCKIVPTSAAREVGYDERLRGGSDFVFWTKLFARHPFRFRVIPGREATYFRTRGHGSLSRQDVSFDFNVTQRLACITSLDDIPTGSGDVERMVMRMVSAQCRLINNFLSQHPSERDRVVAAIDESRPRRFDWRAANRGQAQDLALLYCFTPWNGTGGMVAARRVRERGVVVDVVCKNMDGTRAVDLSSNAIAAPYVDTQFNLDGPVSAYKWNAVVAFSEKAFATLSSEPLSSKTYRSVYSRAMWPPSHFVTAQYKLRNPGVHWIAEFSDPLDRNVEGEPRRTGTVADDAVLGELREGIRAAGFTPPDNDRLFQWAEWVAYALADEIVFTNENQRRYMLGYCADEALADRVRAVSRVAHHPSPPDELYELNPTAYPVDPHRVHLAYFGAFYPNRGLDELTGAIETLGSTERSRVQLHVFTKNVTGVRDAVADAGLADVVTVHPYVDYTAFLNLTRQFDVLLVNDARTSDAHDGINPYLPSKVSDYLGSGTPIWAFYEPGSVLGTIPVAYRTELGDTAAAVLTLREIIATGHRSSAPSAGLVTA